MKIGLASMGDPRHTGTWSGIPSQIFISLEHNGHEVIPIVLQPSKQPWYYNWLRRYYFRLHDRWFLASVEKKLLMEIGKQFDDAVAKTEPEVVIVIHGDWLAYTTFHQPACIIHDTTFAKLIDYYPAFSKLTLRSIKNGNEMYQRALNKAKVAVFSAQWATQSAILDYNIPASKVHTIPFGANLKYVPSASEIKKWITDRLKTDCCNFLFLGIDWKRKGGPDALSFVIELNAMGIKSHLFIVGCFPDISAEAKCFVTIVGYLRKDNESELSTLVQLFRTSHALLLPSLAECYGCVYCEANAYGLPALGRDTGGVSEIIKDSINGLLLNTIESPEAFAQRWAKIWLNKEEYLKLCMNSQREYEERLNYKVFLKNLEDILSDVTYHQVQ